MSKPLPLALLAAIAFANLRAEAVASAAIKVQAKRVNPIAIDGSFGDWKDVPVQYLFKGPRVTAIAHDERYLYVHFRFSDLSLARLVLRTGAIVWINGEARHEASFGLRYRGTTALEKALKEQEGSSDEPPNGAPGGGPPVMAGPLGGGPPVIAGPFGGGPPAEPGTELAPAGVCARVKFSTRMRASSVHLPSGYCFKNAW